MERKLLKIFLFFILSFDIVFASEVDLNSQRFIMYNLNDENIIDEKDSHDEVSIASLTKIMTVIVAIENIDDFNEKVTITNDMLKGIDWDVVTVGYKKGDVASYDDLLYCSILSSGADCVNGLAVSISGSKEDFVKLMNDKVKELGLQNTHFTNVIGLYDKDNYSSAYDMAQILKYSLNNPKFKTIFETMEYKLTNGKTIKSTIKRYNSSNSDISYITGSKTGYIKKAGYCLASTATLNNVNYLLITLNAFSSTSNVHIKDHIKAYNYFNDNYSYKNIINLEDKIVTLDTIYAKEKTIDIYSNVSIDKYLKNDFDKSYLEYKYDGVKEIKYNLKKGSKLGHVTINYKGEKLDEFDLIYEGVLHFSLLNYLWINKFYILIIIVILLLLIRIINVQRRKNKRRKKVISTN